MALILLLLLHTTASTCSRLDGGNTDRKVEPSLTSYEHCSLRFPRPTSRVLFGVDNRDEKVLIPATHTRRGAFGCMSKEMAGLSPNLHRSLLGKVEQATPMHTPPVYCHPPCWLGALLSFVALCCQSNVAGPLIVLY